MPRHEFGIMKNPPEPKKRYDDYEPEKYNCISVDDCFIEPLVPIFSELCYWHTLERPENGMAYTGVTLIPPQSAEKFADLLVEYPELEELKKLLICAKNQNKYVIHFGI